MEKYKVIAKVGDEKFVKYRSENLLSFTRFLDTKFPTWRWFNVYSSTGQQIANYTTKNRPLYKQVSR
jgi:ABC-type uncharacterized transport system permease subunit